MKIPDTQKTILDKAIDWLGAQLSIIFLFIVGISTYEVVMRYCFDAPTYWVHELAMFLGGSLFIIGGAYALANDKHVRVALFYDRASPKIRSLLNIFHNIMGIFFAGIMSWAAYQMTYESWFKPWGDMVLETSGTAWDTHFPAYLKMVILMTMATLFIQFFLKFVNELRLLVRGNHV
ncbi:MAG: TRAP transporter small permease subunit [Gammaproteobacteria bacterium]|nr:TRAP transporter small permease subunit [Gammaproteobacteria bacterium]